MNRLDYDTSQGILEHLGSLDDLHTVIDARRADEEGRLLSRWVLLGRFSLAEFGIVDRYNNYGRSNFIPAEVLPLIPDVLREHEVFTRLSEELRTPKDELTMSTSPTSIPHSYDRCAECHQGWTLRTAYDAQSETHREIMNLDGFEGMSGTEFNEVLTSQKTRDGMRFINSDQWHVASFGIVGENGREFRSVGSDYVIQPSDRAEVIRRSFEHPACKKGRIDIKTKEEFEAMLDEAGFDDYETTQIANTYGSEHYRGPWLRVDSSVGKPFIIGWRKRVINIQWSPEDYRGNIAGDDDVTKSDTNAHAWSREKAVEYLERLKAGLNSSSAVKH